MCILVTVPGGGWKYWFRSELEYEVESERRELIRILGLTNGGNRVQELRQLAVRLGASTIKMHPGYGEAAQPELTQNIQQALQTKAMIAAVRTSSNYLILSIILTFIAFGSMVAAFLTAWNR